MSRFIPALILGLVVISLSHVGDASVHAASSQPQAITLSPASTNITIDAGSVVSKTVDVINSGDDAFNVTLTSTPYYVLGTNYDPHFSQLPGTVDASNWVRLSLTSTKIAGQKTLTVPYIVTVPKGTPAGGYYAVVFVETSTDDPKTGVVSHNRVGDILYITVNGVIKSGGGITGNSLPAVSFVGSIPISANISNTGGTHFISTATYTVTDFANRQVFIATTERYVLPRTVREITASWTPQSSIGVFTVHRQATIDGVVKTLPDEKIVIINPWVFVAFAFLIGILIGIPFERARRQRLQAK